MDKASRLEHFSDVLCIWAYVGQIRIDELRRHFGADLVVDYHFIPVFGSTAVRIGDGWRDRGGYAGYSDHVLDIARAYPHVEVNKQIWRTNVPATSGLAHLVIKAIQTIEWSGLIPEARHTQLGARSVIEEFVWRVRLAFFRDARDIGSMDELVAIAAELDLPVTEIQSRINDGTAMAQWCRDIDLQRKYSIDGSPTYLLNEGRQKLYGNVGYKILEANVRELQEKPHHGASWC